MLLGEWFFTFVPNLGFIFELGAFLHFTTYNARLVMDGDFCFEISSAIRWDPRLKCREKTQSSHHVFFLAHAAIRCHVMPPTPSMLQGETVYTRSPSRYSTAFLFIAKQTCTVGLNNRLRTSGCAFFFANRKTNICIFFYSRKSRSRCCCTQFRRMRDAP